MIRNFGKIVKKHAKDREFNYERILWDYQQDEPELYAVRQIHVWNSDDNLNCAEPWHDYGNYKSFGITDPNSMFFLWDYRNREALVYCKENGKFYSTKEEGEWWNHSENCDTPGRTALAEEIPAPKGNVKLSVEMFFDKELEKDVLEQWKLARTQQLLGEVKDLQKKIEEYSQKLEDLKINHPRAWKQIQNAQKDYFHLKELNDSICADIQSLEICYPTKLNVVEKPFKKINL